MFSSTFQHDQLKKYSIIFGALFNDISLNRIDSSGADVQTIKVPLSYGPKDKWLARVNQNPSGLHTDRPAISLPRMAFELGNVSYDSSRKVGSNIQRISAAVANTAGARAAVYTPVPYNINYTLWIMVKNAVDGTRIIEQILPSFRPQYNVATSLIPSMGIEHDIPIVLQSVTFQDDYEGDYETRRQIIWKLDFILKGYFYGPITNTGIIKLADVNIFNSLTANSASSVVSVQPGLTANGDPTTSISDTVSYEDIAKEDDWAYIVQITEEM